MVHHYLGPFEKPARILSRPKQLTENMRDYLNGKLGLMLLLLYHCIRFHIIVLFEPKNSIVTATMTCSKPDEHFAETSKGGC